MIFVTKPSIAFTTAPDFSTSSLSNPLFPSVPTITTRNGVVHLLGTGRCRKVLCPVPRVVGLEEPPVVPDFLRELEAAGWVPIRVDAYETRWLGPACAKGVVERSDEWEMMRRRWPNLVVVANGPVTAAGAESLGVNVNVVSERFDSFQGTVDAVKTKLRGLDSTCM
ncbi:hypothetical protein NC652_017146 [Populus alba x Populus x berolinensis]|nr:hypothetical protein NC652_017146 [Populus alba x Populus x berolinensis]